MQRTLWVDGQCLTYCLTRKQVKHLNLRVDRVGDVQVSAAPWVDLDTVDAFVQDHADWIARMKAERQRRVRPTGLYLEGRAIQVEVIQGPRSAQLRPGRLLLQLPQITPEAQAAAVEGVKREWAGQRFPPAVTRVLPAFAPWSVPLPQVRVRSMRSRWGSCHPGKGIITLALGLICVPPNLLEGVIAHELAHLVVPNHSPAFYEVLAQVQPDYAARRRALALWNTVTEPFHEGSQDQ